MGCQASKPDALVEVLRGSETGLLDPGGPLLSDPLVHHKTNLHVVCEAILIREDDAERCSIFDGLTRSLRLMWLISSQFVRALFVEWTGE